MTPSGFNSSHKTKLLKGLQEPTPPDCKVILTSRSVKELVKEVEDKLGLKITERGLRYRIKSIAEEHPEVKLRPFHKGPPIKSELTPSEQLLKELSEYLLQLTGLSERALYTLLRTATDQKLPPMGKGTYHKLFKDTRKSCAVQDVPKSENCCIVLGQVLIPPGDQHDQWLVLWGMEVKTRYVNIQIVNLIPKKPLGKRPIGRPKTIKQTDSAYWIDNNEERREIRLPESVLLTFLEDFQRKLGLPIYQLILPHGYPVDSVKCFQKPLTMLEQIDMGVAELSFSDTALKALPPIMALKRILEETAFRHYEEMAEAKIFQLRQQHSTKRKELQVKLRTFLFRKSREKEMSEIIKLDSFYRNKPQFKTKSVKRKLASLKLFVQKKPEESGNTA